MCFLYTVVAAGAFIYRASQVWHQTLACLGTGEERCWEVVCCLRGQVVAKRGAEKLCVNCLRGQVVAWRGAERLCAVYRHVVAWRDVERLCCLQGHIVAWTGAEKLCCLQGHVVAWTGAEKLCDVYRDTLWYEQVLTVAWCHRGHVARTGVERLCEVIRDTWYWTGVERCDLYGVMLRYWTGCAITRGQPLRSMDRDLLARKICWGG